MKEEKEETIIEKKIIGKCKQCGRCCQDIQLDYRTEKRRNRLLKEDITKLLKEAIGAWTAQNPDFDFRYVNEIRFVKESNDVRVHAHNVVCSALKKEGNKYICGIYDDRSEICTEYPCPTSIMEKGCGYRKIKINRKKK